jgi:hypothetical protein
MAVFDIIALQKFLGYVKDLAPCTFDSLYKEGVRRVGYFLLNPQPVFAEHFARRVRVSGVNELDK